MKREHSFILMMFLVVVCAVGSFVMVTTDREDTAIVKTEEHGWVPEVPKISDYIPELDYRFPIHDDDFIWDGEGGDLTSPFGERDPREVGGLGDYFHDGLDLWGVSHVATWRARVVAVEDGVILNHWINHEVYGKMIEILHLDGSISMYAHLSKSYIHERRVVNGELVPWIVEKGDVIGRIGDTSPFYKVRGMKTHLHFQLTIDGRLVNPLKYIKVPE